MSPLTVGTRIYYHGNMASERHFGTIVAVQGWRYQIQPDPGRERIEPYWTEACMFYEKYLGHGGTPFVTEAAYQAWRAERYAALTLRRGPTIHGQLGSSRPA